MFWKTISICLCIYGVLKEFRPSESYIIPFLQGSRMNFTEEQINNEILPIGIYSMMVSMVFVTLMIDLLRYKAVIVIQAICGACVYAILSICTSFTSIVVVEILYGIFTAAEVGYSTYIYSVVEVKYYQKVTSYMRAALLMGHFFSSIMAQVSISIKLFNVYQLNFFTFASLTAGTFWTIILLPSKRKLSKHETEMIPMNVDEETLKEVIFYPKDNDDCSGQMRETQVNLVPLFLMMAKKNPLKFY